MKVRYTIEPSWTTSTYAGQVEIDDAELENLTEAQRGEVIEMIVGEAVNSDVPWGWEVIE